MSIFAVMFTAATGLVAAGLVESLWGLVTGESLRLELPESGGFSGALKGLAIVLALPLLLGEFAVTALAGGDSGRVFGFLAIGGAAVWCLVQGVVIVSTVLTLAPGDS